MGIGGFAVPFYMTELGWLTGIIFVIIAGTINFLTFMIIFEMSDKKKINTYPDLVQSILGDTVFKIFRVTMLVEFLSVALLYCLASWNLFQYFGYYVGLFKEEWFINK